MFSFKDIIGQEVAKQRLIQEVQEGRIPHAQLFCGPAGVGKLPLALAYARYICCPNRTETDACGTCPSCYVSFFNLGDVEALRAAEDGGQYHFRSFGNEEEYRFLGRLFQQLQQLVGADFVHLFGQPYDGDFVTSFTGFQTQLAGYLVAFLGIDDGLSVFGIHLVQPMVQSEVGAVLQQVPPVGDIVVADFLFPFGTLDDRVYEVYVRVHQLVPFYAGGTKSPSYGYPKSCMKYAPTSC